ncbi:MAG: galactokinase [Anaerolineales bacterium]|nr:galactokinase [Anaerolineales bacterium]MCB8936983.1 galactokinase [Ardenticatenaceae bacterium]
MDLHQKVTIAFTETFGTAPPLVVQAPGRVNLIGEHTDYNDGFVLPMAIDRGIWLSLRPRDDDQVSVHSLDFGETAVFDLNALATQPPAGSRQKQAQNANLREVGVWAEYLKGVAWALQEAGHTLRGWEGVMTGNVPKGAGLSSSAALELATARAFQQVSGFAWDAAQMAKLSQRAENKWVGVNCGIMDQMISASGQAGHALLIDCRSLETQSVPLPPALDGSGTAVVILDTTTRRGLVDSAYNERRQQCEEAATYFGVSALRDVSISQFLAEADNLAPLTRRRAKHVITENLRTLNAAKAMQNADAALLGQLMNESHTSLRDDFEVTNEALNIIVDIAQAQDGCFGARMTGAGFGGCAVALVHEAKVASFVTAVSDQYHQQTNRSPKIYVCQPSDGAAVIAQN